MKKRKTRKGTIDRGETFDEFLDKDGLLAETQDAAIKRIIADQIKLAMDKQRLSKTKMAARIKTNPRQLDQLLDPNNQSVTLATLRRAASAVGKRLTVGLDHDDYTLAELRTRDPELVPVLTKNDAGAELLKLLRTKYGPAEVATYNSRAWELSGVHLLNAGRVNEALTVLWGLYEKMLEAQKTLGRVHKATPLVWISDCLYRLNFPVHAKRYLNPLRRRRPRGGWYFCGKDRCLFSTSRPRLAWARIAEIRKGDFPTRTRDARKSPISGGAITAVG